MRSTHSNSDVRNFKRGQEFEAFSGETIYRERNFDLGIYTDPEYQKYYGESRAGVEIKLDERCSETGRFSIEYFKKTQYQRDTNHVRLSDIWRPERNTHSLLQGNYDVFMVFRLDRLYDHLASYPLEWYTPDRTMCIARKFLPLREAVTIAEDVFVFDAAVKRKWFSTCGVLPIGTTAMYETPYPKPVHNLPHDYVLTRPLRS